MSECSWSFRRFLQDCSDEFHQPADPRHMVAVAAWGASLCATTNGTNGVQVFALDPKVQRVTTCLRSWLVLGLHLRQSMGNPGLTVAVQYPQVVFTLLTLNIQLLNPCRRHEGDAAFGASAEGEATSRRAARLPACRREV